LYDFVELSEVTDPTNTSDLFGCNESGGSLLGSTYTRENAKFNKTSFEFLVKNLELVVRNGKWLGVHKMCSSYEFKMHLLEGIVSKFS
jgi:hypothetical protein